MQVNALMFSSIQIYVAVLFVVGLALFTYGWMHIVKANIKEPFSKVALGLMLIFFGNILILLATVPLI
jgi:hypothetical protein